MKLFNFVFFLGITLFLQSCSSIKKEAVKNVENDFYEAISFKTIAGNNTIKTFQMSETEVTNEQYAKFLNEAYQKKYITYNSMQQMVYDLYGNQMIWLGGSRVVKDHNRDGIYELDEMENPLNRCFIKFDKEQERFLVVDPYKVKWSKYFNTSIYPNVVDNKNNWAELNSRKKGWYGEGDVDGELPNLNEVRKWPVTFIRYYGAEAFAKFYGYDLPTKKQWQYTAKGGEDFNYATSNGTDDEGVAWINIYGPFQRHRGHVQKAKSKKPNPYGIYNLGGNVWEWCKDWYNGTRVFGGPPKKDGDFFINATITNTEAKGKYLKCLLGGSFNFFPRTMSVNWNHAAFTRAGNDHFGFRVVKNE